MVIGAAHAAEEKRPPGNPAEPVATDPPYFQGRDYVVQPGDTLWDLAGRHYVVPYYWPHIWNLNEKLSNPDQLRIDELLWLPTLEGTPGSLTAADRRSIAEGYLKLYQHLTATGGPHPEHALIGARYYDPSVLPPALRTTGSELPPEQAATTLPPAEGPANVSSGEPDTQSGETPRDAQTATRRDDRAGLRVGSFRFNAGASLGRSYDDNLYASRSDTESDQYTSLGTWFSLASDWQRHAVGLRLSADHARYAEESDENYTDAKLRLDGRYDLSPGNNVFGSLSAARAHEERTAVNLPGAAEEPTIYREAQAVLGIARRLGDTELRLGVTGTQLDYDDVPLGAGGEANNDDRDRYRYQLGGRLTLLRPGGWQPFAQLAAEDRRYTSSRDDLGFERSSNGSAAAVGVTRSLPGGYAELFAGYMRQSYEDGRLGTVTSPDFGLRLNTILSGHTRLQARADRSFEETTLPDVPATLDTTAAITLEHRVSPGGTFTLPAFWIHSEFKRSNREDDVTGVGLTYTHQVSRHISVYAGHSFERRDSDVPTADYQKGTTYAGLSAELAPEPLPALAGGGSSGPYIGIHGGQALLAAELAGARGPSGGGGTLDAQFGDWAVIGGGFIGYGWSHGRWLTALEVEADDVDGEWTHDLDAGGRTFSFSRDEGFALSGRLGYWLDGAGLLYGRAGLAKTAYNVAYDDGSGGTADVTEHPRGVRFGTGIELALTRHLFGRLDWRYTDYHPLDVDYTSGVDEFSPTATATTLGLGYRFFNGGQQRAPTRPFSTLDGGYVGLAVGWGALHTENTGDQRGSSGARELSADRADTGGTAGAFGGYGLRFGRLYLAAELTAEGSDTDWISARRPDRRVYAVERGPAYGAGLRAGYVLQGPALLYVHAARLRTQFATDFQFAGEGVDIDDDRTLSGDRIGLGVEVPASEHLFVRLDASYTDYDEYRLNYTTSTGDGTETFDNDEDLFRLGLGYRF